MPFEAIQHRLKEEQKLEDEDRAEVDFIFDIPVELAAELTGFRYDQTDEIINTFSVLARTGVQSSDWFSRLRPAVKRRR